MYKVQESDNDKAIRESAQTLAERTTQPPLEELASLCPLAEKMLHAVMNNAVVPGEFERYLGLREEKEIRDFCQDIISRANEQPQDMLAYYLYQGKAAAEAGIDPAVWLQRVQRHVRYAVLKITHHFQHGSPLHESVKELFGLHNSGSYNELRLIWEKEAGHLAGKLRFGHDAEIFLRRLSAEWLIRYGRYKQQKQKSSLDSILPDGKIPVAPQVRKTLRIPLSAEFLRPTVPRQPGTTPVFNS